MSRRPPVESDVIESPETKERRFVYSGEETGGSSEYFTRGNRPLKRRRKSPFKIVSLLVVISGLIVFYVWNKITVNHLAEEIKELEKKMQTVSSTNRYLKADVDKKGSLERITALAKGMGMINPSEQPIYFEVDNYTPVSVTAGQE